MSNYLLLGLLGLGLSSQAQKHHAISPAKSATSIKHSAYKTLKLSTPCAVLYWLNAARIEQMKKPDSLGFYIVADDMMFYSARIHEYLTKRKIKVVETDTSFLLFVPSAAPVKVFDLCPSTYDWALFYSMAVILPMKLI